MEQEEPELFVFVSTVTFILIFCGIVGIIFLSFKAIKPAHSLYRISVLFSFLHFFLWYLRKHWNALKVDILFFMEERPIIRLGALWIPIVGYVLLYGLLLIIWIKYKFIYSLIVLILMLVFDLILASIHALFGLNVYGRYFMYMGLVAVPIFIILIYKMIVLVPLAL
jgi:hypothetical protein